MITDRKIMASREGVTQLGYLGIGVTDLTAWRDFATNVLGMQEAGSGSKGSLRFRIDGYQYRFELFPSGEDDLLYAGWEVKDAEALRKVENQVRSLGTEVVEATAAEAAERKVIGLIRFKDPDDLLVEVYCGPLQATSAFNSPRNLAGFKAQGLGLGHIVLRVRNTDTALRFYIDGLGVKLSDYVFMKRGDGNLDIAFMRVNPRHHSVALVQRPIGTASDSPPKRLVHFLLETTTLDDVGAAIDLAARRSVPMRKLGKHINDRMISFYMVSPSGFDVEYGFDGLLIEDEASWNIRHYDVPSIWGHQ